MNTAKEEVHILWNTYRPLWTSWARKLSYVDDEQEDLYQESYILLMKAIEYYDESKGVPFGAFYKMILYRWGKHYIRKLREQTMEIDDLNFYLDQQPQKGDLLLELLQGEQLKKLDEAIRMLEVKDREVIMRFYFEGESLNQIAKVLGLTMRGVVNRKERVLEKLYRKCR